MNFPQEILKGVEDSRHHRRRSLGAREDHQPISPIIRERLKWMGEPQWRNTVKEVSQVEDSSGHQFCAAEKENHS